jgi:hypothetical protein
VGSTWPDCPRASLSLGTSFVDTSPSFEDSQPRSVNSISLAGPVLAHKCTRFLKEERSAGEPHSFVSLGTSRALASFSPIGRPDELTGLDVRVEHTEVCC